MVSKRGPIFRPSEPDFAILRAASGEQSSVVSVKNATPGETFLWLALAAYEMKYGGLPPPLVRDEIVRQAIDHERMVFDKWCKIGIAPELRALFAAKKKKEMKKLAASVSLDKETFCALLHNAPRELGLTHAYGHFDFPPEGTSLTPEDHDSLASKTETPARKRAKGKVNKFFSGRVHRSSHVLFDDARWFIFYLTFRDIGIDPRTGENHWAGGSHIHLVSHLSRPGLSREDAMLALEQRHEGLPHEHIRFREDGRRPGEGQRRLVADPRRGRFNEVE